LSYGKLDQIKESYEGKNGIVSSGGENSSRMNNP